LATMQFLTYLFLSQNAFDKGPIPEFLSGMDHLRELSLADTQRTGTVPGAWLDLLDPLVLLDLSRNELTGTLPSQLWGLPHLEYLFLNRNQLTGEIPSGISSSTNNHTTNLQVLVLDKNSITGNLTDACMVQDSHEGESHYIQTIIADCGDSSNEIVCDCCVCCSDEDAGCNDEIWDLNAGFDWEQNYTRSAYAFSPQILQEGHTSVSQQGRRILGGLTKGG
jgi:Leucine rich repeat